MSQKPVQAAPGPILPEQPRPGLWGRLPPRVRQTIVAIGMSILAGVLSRYGIPIEPEIREKVVKVAVPEGVPVVSREPVNYEGCRFHGDEPAHLEAEAARWPTDRITYGIDYASARGLNPPLSDDAIRAAFRQATGWWSEQLALEFVETSPADAMIPCRFEFIDGPTRVLAQAFLADGRMTPKALALDNSERWTPGLPAANLLSLPTVLCHEIGHSLGLGHDGDNAPAVMRPSYSSNIPREQPQDINRMLGIGYRRRPAVPPAATDVLNIPVQVKTDDVIRALENAGYKVGK